MPNDKIMALSWQQLSAGQGGKRRPPLTRPAIRARLAGNGWDKADLDMLYVSSLADMPDGVARLKPSHLISLLAPQELPPTPPGVASQQHLKVAIDDICEPMDGQVHPEDGHIEEILSFAAGWDRARPLLVHCYAGVSRSMATALILLCLESRGREAEVASLISARAPHAHPNRLMVAIADRLLGCDGRLQAAVEAMPLPDYSGIGPIVTLPSRLPSLRAPVD